MKWRTGVILPLAIIAGSCKHSNAVLPRPKPTTTVPVTRSSTSAAPTAAPSTTAVAATVPANPAGAPLDNTAVLNCLAKNEGNPAYDRIHTSGVNFGRYGFDQRTWDSVVGRAGYPEYVGRNPIEAPPHVQDAAATLLYEERGTQPWPPSVGEC